MASFSKRPPTPPLPAASPPSIADADFDPHNYSLQKFRLYETRARFYLIGSDRDKRFYRVLKIDRSEPSELNISEDPVVYSPPEVKNLLQRIGEGNRSTGGLAFVAKVYGIVGCIKFLESYYLLLVTKRQQIGCICGHAIYCILESQMIAVPHSSIQSDVAHSKTELRYKKLLSSVDLTKDFFYSYTYPLMLTLQKNVLRAGRENVPYENMFVWNAFLTEPIRSRCSNTRWTIPLVHGYFKQVRLSIFGRDFSVTLISRRSRHFAGTRYLKRGVNDRGRVANDVETEQIVLDEGAGRCTGKMSSVVQMRGSIPLFWSQEASRFSPKPDIILQRYDPTYDATRLHFEDVARRYGNPIIILSLIKTVEKRPREMMLRREFANAVGYLNQIVGEENQLKFIHWDFHKFAKSKSANVLAVLGVVASEALDLTGFYYSGKPFIPKRRSSQLNRATTGRDGSLGDFRASSGDLARMASSIENFTTINMQSKRKELNEQLPTDNGPRFQCGVLRTNCIDCLDRTNVAQYAYGLAALGRQLHAMGLTDVPNVDPDSSIAAALMDMYQGMGDALAQQYGGSEAHNTVFPERQGKWKATTQSREFLKSIKRYYSNAYTDGEKQDAINLFLGYFQPKEGKSALWELDTDYYLHVSGIGDEVIPDDYNNSLIESSPSEGIGAALKPISGCKQDFSRVKLTSFDKLIGSTCSLIKNVRLSCEFDVKANGTAGNHGMAADAAEIQLKSPNWLFGQRKYQESAPAAKVAENENTKEKIEDDELFVFVNSDLTCLPHPDDISEEDIFKRKRRAKLLDMDRYIWTERVAKTNGSICFFKLSPLKMYLATASVNDENNWYGGTLIYGQDESSEAYKHYAELCQGPMMDPFENDLEREKAYADALLMGLDTLDNSVVESDMEAVLKEYDQIGGNLGIFASCRGFAEDPSKLTRWIIGEEKVHG